MEKLSLYFAHPVNVFNTKLEKEMIDLIQVSFGDAFKIENPNQKHHQENYKKWKEAWGNGMRYYFEIVLPQCYGCISMSFLDGKWGMGVAGEAEFYLKKNSPNWLIDVTKKNKVIRSLTPGEKKMVSEFNPKLVLSIEKTREYTWEVLYKVFKPYEKAHLV